MVFPLVVIIISASTWISDVADHKVEMWRTFSSVDELGSYRPQK